MLPHLWELLGAGWSGKAEKQDVGYEEVFHGLALKPRHSEISRGPGEGEGE